jgi:O-methyltransferase
MTTTSIPAPVQPFVPPELNDRELQLFRYVRMAGLTMVSDERLFDTILACRHALAWGFDGDFVECGVWRGGNSILAAGIFKMYGSNKKVYLFDTFEGMTRPTDNDAHLGSGKKAMGEFIDNQKENHNDWCYASLEDVKANFERVNLLGDNIVFVKGDVAETLAKPENLPQKISVLRLDTDWYESTKLELDVLYPRLSVGGVLIIDDYGHWAGSKKAVDEYFSTHHNRPLLHITDYTGRSGIKLR